MTRLSLACAFAAGMVIATSACGGSGPRSVSVRYGSMVSAAAATSHHCVPVVTSADSNGLLWLAGGPRPLAYYASSDGDPPDEVLSTRGPARRPWGLLWPCRPPVVIHYPRTHTASRSSKALLTVLSTKPSKRKTITLGQIRLANPENWNSLSGYANGLIAPSGKIIFFSGTKIRYAGGPEFSVHGLPEGWQIGSLVVSPRNPRVFLAVAAANGKVGSRPARPVSSGSRGRPASGSGATTAAGTGSPCNGALTESTSRGSSRRAATRHGSRSPMRSAADSRGSSRARS